MEKQMYCLIEESLLLGKKLISEGSKKEMLDLRVKKMRDMQTRIINKSCYYHIVSKAMADKIF